MKVVVFGATGGTGRHLVQKCQLAGHSVTVLVRNPAKAADFVGVRIMDGDARDSVAVAKAIEGQDAVLEALGGADLKPSDLLATAGRHIIAGMKAAGVRRIVVLGAAGALHDAQKYQSWRRKLAFWVFSHTFLKHPLKDSAAQEAQVESAGLDYTIVHPPRLLDIPATGKLREMPDGLPPGGYSIPREEVAAFMVRVLEDPKYFRTGPYVSY